MISSVRTIVRWPIEEYPALAPGDVVLISHLAFEPGDQKRHFPATAQRQPCPVLWLCAEDLLPASKFLQHQPSSGFWMLGLKQALVGHDVDQFISDPIRQTLGPKGFRFESPGELFYYVKHYQLRPEKFMICYVSSLRAETPFEDSKQNSPATL